MAGKVNFSVIKGDTFRKTPTFRRKTTKAPVDLTGASIVGHITSSIGDEALTCSIVNPTAGQFRFELPSANTALLPVEVCTIEVICQYADNTVQTLIQGNVVVTE